jgi:LPS export ABC transporter protein LptC
MKTQNMLKVFVLLMFVILLYAIFAQFQPRKRTDSLADYKPDGLEMKYVAYNRENQKSIEVTCSESQKQDDDTTLMHNIRATIYKKGELDQEIYISGDRGYAYPKVNDFFLEQNVKITSEDLEITCENFTIKSKHKLFTDKIVDYQTRNLEGLAHKGMEYYIKVNFVKLFDTHGTYSGDNQQFLYKTDELLIIDKTHTVVFETNTEIKEEKSVLTSDHLVLNFTADFDQIKHSTSQKNSYLFREDQAKKETMEIKSKFLQGIYNKKGKMKTAIAKKKARLELKSGRSQTVVTSPNIKMRFNPATGQLSSSKISPNGNVSSKGKSNFTVAAHTIDLTFKNGDITYGKAQKNCRFKIDDYSGHTKKMKYDIPKNTIHLIGEESEIKKDRNRFISKDFIINTQKDLLTSDVGIKSIIVPEGQDFLFSADSIFVNAKVIEIHNRENKVVYQDNIRLQQNETIITCDKLEILEKNRMNSKGNVSLSFKEKENEINLRGDEIIFDPDQQKITIKGKGVMKSNSRLLKAEFLEINFNDQNELDTIRGKKNIQFINEGIQGTAKQVNWKYLEEMMIFSDSAQISSQSKGITKGKELQLDLKTNKITILSDPDTRSETVIHQ